MSNLMVLRSFIFLSALFFTHIVAASNEVTMREYMDQIINDRKTLFEDDFGEVNLAVDIQAPTTGNTDSTLAIPVVISNTGPDTSDTTLILVDLSSAESYVGNSLPEQCAFEANRFVFCEFTVEADDEVILNIFLNQAFCQPSLSAAAQVATLSDFDTDSSDNTDKASISFPSFYTQNKIILSDRVRINRDLLANRGIVLGKDSTIIGNVRSNRNVFMDDRSLIKGSLIYTGKLYQKHDAVIEGNLIQSETTLPRIPHVDIHTGDENRIIKEESSTLLLPGDYNTVIIKSRAQVIFQPGNYNFKRLIVEQDASLLLDNSSSSIRIGSEKALFIGSRVDINQTGSNSVTWYLNGCYFYIGDDVEFVGNLIAPYAFTHIGNRSHIQGCLATDHIYMKSDSLVGELKE